MPQVDLGLNLSSKKTCKRAFLEQMQQVVLCQELTDLIAHYAPEGCTGRPVFPIDMLHGQEVDSYGDAGYKGGDRHPDMPDAKPERKFQWHIAMKRSRRKALDHRHPILAMQEQLE